MLQQIAMTLLLCQVSMESATCQAIHYQNLIMSFANNIKGCVQFCLDTCSVIETIFLALDGFMCTRQNVWRKLEISLFPFFEEISTVLWLV